MRKVNSFKNFISSIIPFFIIAILGFIKVDVFISKLGNEIFAINQLFFQLFSYLSLLEAGIGVLITQRYFKHLIDANHEQINKIYTFSVKFLRKVSIIIILVGIAISFLLKFMTNNSLSLLYMQFVFVLFLTKNVIDYLMFSPRFVLQADQKIYKVNLKINLSKILESCFEIGLLLIGFNYICILIVGIIIRIIFNYIINNKIFKEYPWLKMVNDDQIEKVAGMKNVFIHKITGAVYNNTDIIIISSFLDPIKVVIYSSYNYIIKFITDFVYMLSNAITASYGNVAHKESKKDQYIIFEEMNSIFLFCAMLFSILIYVLINSFVAIWIGSDKLIDNISFILMLIIMFYNIARKPFIIMRDSVDLFKATSIVSIIEAAINLVLSIILINIYGMPGILFATAFSSLVTTYWFYPRHVYKNIFEMSPKKYYFKYILCMLITILICFTSTQLINIENVSNYLYWVLIASIYSIVIFIVLMLINYILFPYFRRFLSKVVMLSKDVISKNKRIVEADNEKIY